MESNLAHQAEKDMRGKAETQAVPSTNAIGLHFNLKSKPWDDVRVRKAAALAINREAAVAVNFQGDAVLGGMTPPTGPWRLDDAMLHAIPGFAPKPAPDAIAEAKKLLAEAGFPNGFSTRLVVRRDDRFGPWGVFLKDQLAKVGVDAKLELQEPALYTESQKNKNYDLHGGNLSIALDDPDAAFGNQVLCDAPGNFSQICEASIDSLYARQSETQDPAERKRLSNQLEVAVLSNYLVYPVAYSFRFQATRSEVRDCKLHPQTNNNRRMQDVWIAKT
jgi:ABC-type transport system substrate-binding protein